MSYGRKNDFGTIIQIGDILVSEEVVTEFFACDYPVCKGICCVIGDSGAPLEEEELDDLEREYPVYSLIMRPQGRAQVDKDWFFIIDRDGDIVTPVVDGTGECAFTTFDDDGNCFCSMRSVSSPAHALSVNHVPAGCIRSESRNCPMGGRLLTSTAGISANPLLKKENAKEPVCTSSSANH